MEVFDSHMVVGPDFAEIGALHDESGSSQFWSRLRLDRERSLMKRE
jgi:hypothetical protein